VSLSAAARDLLKRLVDYEDQRIAEYKKQFPNNQWQPADQWPWTLSDVGLDYHDVKDLVAVGAVKKVGRRHYIVNRDAAKTLIQAPPTPTAATVTVPDFSAIEGYDDVKRLFQMSLRAEEPVHILMVGPPATAKTMFLMDIEKLEGSRLVVAGTMTRVGLRDVLFYERPRYLLIDEVDKVQDRDDLASLLTWMESGRVVVTMHNVRKEVRGKGWVYAAANSADKLPRELLDRFTVLHFKAYTPEEYVRVATSYLTKTNNTPPDLAQFIVRSLADNHNYSVREAIRVARLAKTISEAEFAIKTITKYSAPQH
jgi:Holliday junction DNA helicase RuvB